MLQLICYPMLCNFSTCVAALKILTYFIRVQIIWAPTSEFVSSSIPSRQISTSHAQPFRGARDLAFCLKVPLDSLLVWASSEGSGETAWMRRLAWTFAARIGDKYQIRLTRSISSGPLGSMSSFRVVFEYTVKMCAQSDQHLLLFAA